MKFRKYVYLMAVCCLLAGCEKKNNDTQAVSDTSATDNVIDTITTTEITPENTEADTKNTDIPEDAVLKITETTYRDGEVWQTLLTYRNDHDDVVASGYISSDGKELYTSHCQYKYNQNGKKIYAKTIYSSGGYFETEYLSDNTQKGKSYDENGRLDGEDESIFDEYGNHIMSHTIIYDENGEVAVETIEDNSDCDYGENGKILVCRHHSESGELYSTTTNTYDDNGNMLSSEKVYADGEKSGCYCIFHSYEYDIYEYDNKNNLISEKEIRKSDEDTVYCSESYEYQYDENGRKIRQDHSYVRTDYDEYDMNISEYTIYEYTQL